MLDTIIALLIICLTLTSTYSLFIRGFKLENKLIKSMDTVLEESKEYDGYIKKIFEE